MNSLDIFWKHRERARLADLAGVSNSYLSDILHRKRGVSQRKARTLEAASREALGDARVITWGTWMCNKTTAHVAFFGEPTRLDSI